MSKEDEVLAALVEAGALVQDTITGTLTMPIHAEIIGTAPDQQLFWMDAGGEDQHSTHLRAFDAGRVMNARDLSFTRDGQAVAYVAPLTEWPGVDAHDLAGVLAQARADVDATEETKVRFQRFIEATRPQLGRN